MEYALRVPAYGGVMAARVEAQRDPEGQRAAPAEQGRQQGQQDQAMDLTQFRLAHPGLITISRVAQEEVE